MDGILVLSHAVITLVFVGLYVSKVGIQCPVTGFGYGVVIGILGAGGDLILRGRTVDDKKFSDFV